MARTRKPRVDYKKESERLQKELDGLTGFLKKGAVPLTMSIAVSRITKNVGFSIGNPLEQTLEAALEDLTLLGDALSVVQRQVDSQKTQVAKALGAKEAHLPEEGQVGPLPPPSPEENTPG